MSRRSQTYAMMPVAYSPYISAPVQAMQHPYGLYLRAAAPQGAVNYYMNTDEPAAQSAVDWYVQDSSPVTKREAEEKLADLIKYNDKLEQILQNHPAVMLRYNAQLTELRNILLKYIT